MMVLKSQYTPITQNDDENKEKLVSSISSWDISFAPPPVTSEPDHGYTYPSKTNERSPNSHKVTSPRMDDNENANTDEVSDPIPTPTEGRLTYTDGSVFEGLHVKGLLLRGKMTYGDGSSVYEGEWRNGKRHGRGICIFSDGSVYEGDFKKSHIHGHGVMIWSDGGWYLGDWHKDEMHGWGMELEPDGTVRHEGRWKRGVPVR
jgi:hypothetical protein